LDIFSRYVVGWMIVPAESAALAEKLIKRNMRKTGHRKRPAYAPR
jgi:hypothetical protein